MGRSVRPGGGRSPRVSARGDEADDESATRERQAGQEGNLERLECCLAIEVLGKNLDNPLMDPGRRAPGDCEASTPVPVAWTLPGDRTNRSAYAYALGA
jgi:hypothetical protein